MQVQFSSIFQPVSGRSWVRLPLEAHKILFLSILTWERFFIIYTLSKSSIHLSFIHIYNFDTLSLAVWQDTCHTYKNLVYDLAHHESPIAQWLERPTGIWKVKGSTPVGASVNSFSEYRGVFQLENAFPLFTLYPISNPFIIYSHLSFQHVGPSSMARHMSRGFIKGQALAGCERDLAINLPGCFRLLFLLSFKRKTKNAWLINCTDLQHKNLMKPLLHVSFIYHLYNLRKNIATPFPIAVKCSQCNTRVNFSKAGDYEDEPTLLAFYNCFLK